MTELFEINDLFNETNEQLKLTKHEELKFTELLSVTSPMLSLKSIVKNDGILFWPSIKHFYMYRGGEGVNIFPYSIYLEYFYNKLDMENRHLIFSMKNTQHGEIYWFYPDKGQDPDNVFNNRVLIYNIKENLWTEMEIDSDIPVDR